MYIMSYNGERYVNEVNDAFLFDAMYIFNHDTYNDVEDWVDRNMSVFSKHSTNENIIIRKINEPEKLYNEYKLKWLADHGYTIESIINCLDSLNAENYWTGGIDTILDLYREWETGVGFNGEIWVCYDEWVQNELFEMYDM